MTTTSDLALRNDTAPAQAAAAALAIRTGQTTFDDFQNAALNQLGLRNASNADRAVFLHQCQRTGLDPFAKQIYMIERQGKWTIQTGIDGWRVIRTRAERREGVRAKLGRALFYDGDGNEYKVWVRTDPPAACSITLVIGEAEYVTTLLYREYVQLKDSKPMAQWASKPAHMLEKCTEADVYRKAFPQDFSGVYLDDAMPPADEAAPARQRVTDDAVRARQTVTATVVTPDVPPAAEQVPPVPAEPGTPGPGTAGGTPRLASSGQVGMIRSNFTRLYPGEETPTERLERLAQTMILARREEPLGSTKELTSEQAAEVLDALKRVGSKAELEALTGGGEVPGE